MINSRDINDLLPEVKTKVEHFVALCEDNGIDLLITSTYRDHESQDALYAQGRTTKGFIVTNAKGGDSYHNYRCAIDVVPLINGKPEWKLSSSMTWSLNQFTVGAFTQYISPVDDTGLLDSVGSPWVIDSQITANLYGQVEFDKGLLANSSLKIGVRNLTDEKPPLSSNGYLGSVYQPYSRYWYMSVRKSF